MNKRLLAYLRSLGLAQDAEDGAAWEFYQGLRGQQRSIANALNYVEEDVSARTNCDLVIRALGFNPDDPTQLLDSVDGQRSEAEDQGESGGDDLEAVRRQAHQEERQRASQIREMAEGVGIRSDLVEQVVGRGDTLEQARAAFLDEVRRNRQDVPPDGAPAGHSRNSQTDYDRNSLCAAMMIREGISDPSRQWAEHRRQLGSVRRSDQSGNDQLVRAVDRGAELASLSMVELVARCLRTDGVQVDASPAAIGAALQEQGRAAMSTSTLTGVFTTSYAALLLASYEDAPDSTEGWTVSRDVPDFKTNERTRMEKMGPLKKLGKGGTAEDMTISDAQETYKVFRYAGKFTIDEQDLINDTFGALNDFTPEEMGAAAAQLRADIVYAILLANENMRDGVALFHASHNNVLTSSALGVSTLEAARSKMRIQRENNRNLNLMAKYLIVPGQLESTAETLVESNVVVTGSGIVRGELNTNSRAGLTVRADARLDNGVIDPRDEATYSGSATTWFLAAAGSRHTIEVGYLRGMNRAPRVRSFVLDKGQFGIGFDVSHDIGGKALDWRGLERITA